MGSFQSTPSDIDTSALFTNSPRAIVPSNIRRQTEALARRKVAAFFVRKFSSRSSSELGRAMGRNAEFVNDVFRQDRPAPLGWALAAAIVLPDLPREHLGLTVNEKYQGRFIDALYRLTGETLSLGDLNAAYDLQMQSSEMNSEDPFEKARAEHYRESARPRNVISDEWLWQRRKAFENLLRDMKISASEFCEKIGCSMESLVKLLNGRRHLLGKEFDSLLRLDHKLNPIDLFFLGSTRLVNHGTKKFDEAGIGFNSQDLSDRLKTAQRELKAGREPDSVETMGLTKQVGDEKELDWESAYKRVLEIKTGSSADTFVHRPVPHSVKCARASAAIEVSNQHRTVNKAETAEHLGIGSAQSLFELLEGRRSLPFDTVEALLKKHPELSVASLIVFAWPADWGVLIRRAKDRGSKSGISTEVIRHLEAYQDQDHDPASLLDSAHLKNRRFVSPVLELDKAARALFFISIIKERGLSGLSTAESSLNIRTGNITRIVTGQETLKPEAAKKMFNNAGAAYTHFLPVFLSRHIRAEVKEELGKQVSAKREKEMLEAATAALSAINDDLGVLKHCLDYFGKVVCIPTERISGRSLELRKQAFEVLTELSETPPSDLVPNNWQINKRKLRSVRTGRTDLTLGQTLKLIEQHREVPPELFYFCVAEDMKPLFPVLAKFLCKIEISMVDIESMEAGDITVRDFIDVVRTRREEEKRRLARLERERNQPLLEEQAREARARKRYLEGGLLLTPEEKDRNYCFYRIIIHAGYGHNDIIGLAKKSWRFTTRDAAEFERRGWLSAPQGLKAAVTNSHPGIEFIQFIVHPSEQAEFRRLAKARLQRPFSQLLEDEIIERSSAAF